MNNEEEIPIADNNTTRSESNDKEANKDGRSNNTNDDNNNESSENKIREIDIKLNTKYETEINNHALQTKATLQSNQNSMIALSNNHLNEEIELLDHSFHSDSNPKSNHIVDSQINMFLSEKQNEQDINHEDNVFDTVNQLKGIWRYLSNKIDIKAKEVLIVEDFNKMNFLKRLLIQCSPEYKLLPQLHEERMKIFSIAKMPYDQSNDAHKQYLQHIYHFLLQRKEPKQYDWELIGFQGEPGNDLRSVGMMGVVQMIALIETCPVFALHFFTYLKTIDSEWIFAILLLNMTKLTLDLLKKGMLISYCNKRKKVLDTLNYFFFGLVYQLNKELLSENEQLVNENNRLTIDYISNLIYHIQEFAEKNPGHFFWNENQLSKSYPSLSISEISNLKEKINY